jgi:hypothetical protein
MLCSVTVRYRKEVVRKSRNSLDFGFGFLVKRENFRDFKSSEKLSEIKPWAPVILIQVKRVSQILSPSVLQYNPQHSNQETEPLLILKRPLPSRLHCNENPIYVVLFWKLRGLSPNFYIYVSVSDLYFPIGSVHTFSCSRIGRANQSWEYINRSQTQECRNLNCGRAQFLF